MFSLENTCASCHVRVTELSFLMKGSYTWSTKFFVLYVESYTCTALVHTHYTHSLTYSFAAHNHFLWLWPLPEISITYTYYAQSGTCCEANHRRLTHQLLGFPIVYCRAIPFSFLVIYFTLSCNNLMSNLQQAQQKRYGMVYFPCDI